MMIILKCIEMSNHHIVQQELTSVLGQLYLKIKQTKTRKSS